MLIIGSGGHGKSVMDSAAATKRYDEILFLTNDLSCTEVAGLRVLHEQNVDFDFLRQCCDEFIVAIGDNNVRCEKYKLFTKNKIRAATVIHPRATVSPYATIGCGTVILAGAVVGAFADVANSCIINNGSIVEHDCVLREGTHISPGAVLSGNVRVGECAWICAGATVSSNVNVGARSVVAAGAAVIGDVPCKTLAAGVPAVIKKEL